MHQAAGQDALQVDDLRALVSTDVHVHVAAAEAALALCMLQRPLLPSAGESDDINIFRRSAATGMKHSHTSHADLSNARSWA